MINLKDERLRRNLTQEQLAEKVGVIRQAISNIELGISKPSIPTAQALAKVLELDDWRKFFED